MVFGPLSHQLSNLAALNTSNQRIRDLILGKYKTELPQTVTFIWVDVRDLALAHVRAAELPEAGGKRFFITAGHYSNREIADVIKDGRPDLADQLPGDEVKGDFEANGELRYFSKLEENFFSYLLETKLIFLAKQFTNLTIQERRRSWELSFEA